MAWLSGYNFRKEINIGSATGAGTDYQVKVIVQPGAGTDGTPAGTVYLNSKSAFFPNDLAFTDVDGTTPLKYWFEYDTNNFWVKVPEDLGSNQSIYLYYNNVSALPLPIDAPNSGIWVRPQTTPVLSVGTAGHWDDFWVNIHSIVLVGTTYHAFYAGSRDGAVFKIGHATSSDGITWARDGATGLVLDLGEAGKWDQYAVNAPCVWYENSTFYMLYAGDAATGNAWKIGLATSSDGTTWTRYDVDNPVMSPTGAAWDSLFVIPGTMMLKESSTYYFYYWGGTNALAANTWQIGLATSADLHTWAKSGNNPILAKGANNAYDSDLLEPCVIKIGNTYYMWYQADSNAADDSYVCLASSSAKDSGWSKATSLNPVLNHEPDANNTTWDNKWTECPIAIQVGNSWRLYYSGSGGSGTTPRMQTGYVVYTVVGNGPETFLLFDDFHGLTLDTTVRWTNTGSFVQYQDTVQKYLSGTGTPILVSKSTYAAPLAIEAKAKVGADWSNGYSVNFAIAFASAWATAGFTGYHYKDATLNGSYFRVDPAGTQVSTAESIVADVWYKLTLAVVANAEQYKVNGVQKGALAVAIPTNPQTILLARAWSSGSYTTYFDWVFVRKCVATEPAISSFGSEEPLAITLSVDGLAHADSLDAFALTQVHNISVAVLSHANAIDNVVLTQIHQLLVDALSHANIIDGPALTQVHQLVVDALSHAHSLDALDLFQIHNLVVQELIHSHSIENIDLIYIAAISLVIQDLIHSHSLDGVSPSQIHQLVVEALSHAHAIDGLALTQIHQLVVEAINHSHSLDGILLSQIHQLIVQVLSHSHTIENIGNIRDIMLIMGNLIHGHSLETVDFLSQNSLLIAQTLQHAHAIDGGWGLRLTEHKTPVPENFTYQKLKLSAIPPAAEGGLGYQRLALKAPAPGPEGDFSYQRLHLKSVVEE